MHQQSNTALRLRNICSQLSDLAHEYRDENQHDEAQRVGEAEESVRGLLSLPDTGESAT